MSSLPKWTQEPKNKHQREQGGRTTGRRHEQPSTVQYEQQEQTEKPSRPIGHQIAHENYQMVRVVLHENDASNWPSTYDPSFTDLPETNEFRAERRWTRRLYPRISGWF